MSKTKYLLLVDDIPFQRTILANEIRVVAPRVLKEEIGLGTFEILEADNGKEALRTVQGQRVDVIFLDLMMPEMDGLTFLNIQRQNPAAASIPVIVVSALCDRATMERVSKLGVIGVIRKPVTAKDVEVNLRRAFAPHLSNDALAKADPIAQPAV